MRLLLLIFSLRFSLGNFNPATTNRQTINSTGELDSSINTFDATNSDFDEDIDSNLGQVFMDDELLGQEITFVKDSLKVPLRNRIDSPNYHKASVNAEEVLDKVLDLLNLDDSQTDQLLMEPIGNLDDSSSDNIEQINNESFNMDSAFEVDPWIEKDIFIPKDKIKGLKYFSKKLITAVKTNKVDNIHSVITMYKLMSPNEGWYNKLVSLASLDANEHTLQLLLNNENRKEVSIQATITDILFLYFKFLTSGENNSESNNLSPTGSNISKIKLLTKELFRKDVLFSEIYRKTPFDSAMELLHKGVKDMMVQSNKSYKSFWPLYTILMDVKSEVMGAKNSLKSRNSL